MTHTYTAPERTCRLRRTRQADRLNAVANHPHVRQRLGGDGPIDLGPVLANPSNIGLELDERGGFVCVAIGQGRYEAHSLFRPDARGNAAARAMRDALDYMFVETDAVDLVTKIPHGNVAASALARLGGFQALFDVAGTWTADATCRMSGLRLTIDEWALRSSAAAALGRWFHAAIHHYVPPHPDEPAHDQMAGAAALLIQAGNVRKGVELYNRWALWAGYLPLVLQRDHPTILAIGEVIVEVRGSVMEVLSCP